MITGEYISLLIEKLNTVEMSIGKDRHEYTRGIEEILLLLLLCKNEKRNLFIIGNGGSAGIAQHMTADFMKNAGLRTIDLYNQPTVTCLANDMSYEYVFCKQLELLANKEDILIVISSSGNSNNIIRAVNTMHQMGGKVITFTGFKADNKLRSMGDINVYVPIEHYGIVESIHNIILQQLVDEIVERDGIAMRVKDDE